MKWRRESPSPLDVRTKLLVMLAVLSLPLLIVSLLQLHSYQRSLNDQSSTIARIETAAVASALEQWLENNPAHAAAGSANLAPEPARDLYQRLRKHAPMSSENVFTVFDAQGRAVPNPLTTASTAVPPKFEPQIDRQRWNDGVMRVTGARRVEPWGWRVAVGVPLAQDTPAGRSILMLTATWALALLASSLLGVWAVGRFTKPLRRLAAAASMLGEGNLRERASVETDDEVGTLAANFNVMASSLQTKFNELQTQGAFIEEVLDSLPLGVLVLDASLIVSKVNSTFAKMVGRDADSLAGRGLYEAAAGMAVLNEVVEDVRRSRKPFVNYGLALDLVARNREPDEPTKFWDVILWPTTRSEGRGDLIVILSEVSKRVRAEKLATAAFSAEKARAAELESVINQMNEGVIIVDARGRYRVNPAAAKILGRKPGEFRDGIHAMVADMDLRDANGRVLGYEETPISRAFDKGESVIGEPLKIVPLDVDERVLFIGATPLVGDDGQREGVVAVFHDITEQVRQHTELVEAYSRLREHDRLKSAFVANVSHELRTPLNVIIGLCQLLARDPTLPLAPLQGEVVMRMERNAHALLDLVNDLLDYSRLEAGRSALQLANVNVGEVVTEIVEGFAEEAREKGITFRADIAPDLGMVYTDRHKLTQVLYNLVSNAVKFTATGSVVVVAAPAGDDRWHMEVSDTGIGMSSDALSYIFDGFRQVDDRLTRPYSGVGLGLAITRKIVELLGGEIRVESAQNEGSRFLITWPRIARPRTGTGSLVGERKTALTDAKGLRARTG